MFLALLAWFTKALNTQVNLNYVAYFIEYSACVRPPMDSHQGPQQKALVSEFCLHHHTCFHQPLQLIVRPTSSQPPVTCINTADRLPAAVNTECVGVLLLGENLGVYKKHNCTIETHVKPVTCALFFTVQTEVCFLAWSHMLVHVKMLESANSGAENVIT